MQRLDDKGRLILPAKFRRELADGLVITRGQERCLTLFSAGEFESVHQRMRQAPMTSKEARDYLRVFLSGAAAEQLDKQGRFTVPQILRRYASLGRDIAVIGVGDHAEIWDAPTWEAYLASSEDGFADRTDEVIPGVF